MGPALISGQFSFRMRAESRKNAPGFHPNNGSNGEESFGKRETGNGADKTRSVQKNGILIGKKRI